MTRPRSTRLWPDWLRYARPHVDWDLAPPILVLDPGETTGWAVFRKGCLDSCGQFSTPHPADLAVNIRAVYDFWLDLRSRYPNSPLLNLILYEEYRVRGNKFKTHVGSEVVTIQHIGAIKVVADELEVPTEKQTAGMAKGFATDPKLRHWGLYQSNQRHANDAIRHGVYYLLFKYAPEHREHAAGPT